MNTICLSVRSSDTLKRGGKIVFVNQQTLQILLALSDARTAILLPKGGFFQQTGGNWIFKLSNDGKTAYKENIQLGMNNPDYYEVLEGLKPGDKVVTSSYENYGDMQELVLKGQ